MKRDTSREPLRAKESKTFLTQKKERGFVGNRSCSDSEKHEKEDDIAYLYLMAKEYSLAITPKR